MGLGRIGLNKKEKKHPKKLIIVVYVPSPGDDSKGGRVGRSLLILRARLPERPLVTRPEDLLGSRHESWLVACVLVKDDDEDEL